LKRTTIDIGASVICDACDADYTLSDATGGMLFGGYGICPQCAPVWESSAETYKERHHIKARAAPGEEFRAFIMRVRGGNNTITITGDDKMVEDAERDFRSRHNVVE